MPARQGRKGCSLTELEQRVVDDLDEPDQADEGQRRGGVSQENDLCHEWGLNSFNSSIMFKSCNFVKPFYS